MVHVGRIYMTVPWILWITFCLFSPQMPNLLENIWYPTWWLHMFIFPQMPFFTAQPPTTRWLCLFAFVCLCGIIWFWLPLAALLASLVLPLLFSGKLLFLLLRVAGCHEYEAPYPWNIKQFVELEVYMRHLPACGNAPRAMLFVIMHVWDSPPSDEGGQFVFCIFLHQMNHNFPECVAKGSRL